jgi:hypothetical protein
VRADGEAEKRKGMARAQRAADRRWWVSMLECGKIIAQRKSHFTSGDIVELCRARYPKAFTPEPRAIGPLMRALATLGYCRPTTSWVQSTQSQNHHRPMSDDAEEGAAALATAGYTFEVTPHVFDEEGGILLTPTVYGVISGHTGLDVDAIFAQLREIACRSVMIDCAAG